jgi:formate dehydrogenase subunit gamma
MKRRFKRFSTARIVEHWLYMVIFSVLVVTGLSQKYYSSSFSEQVMLHFGGIDMVRSIHRYAGFIFSCAITAHIVIAVVGMVFKKWQPSMVITKSDIDNAIHNVKYYLGHEQNPALSHKYDYMQKFEYWGILTGGIIMFVTGVVLWYPLFITRFMSGEIIPAAKVLHSNEALVVILIIALWHTYNAIFSPEVFPLNASIFTGYISRERMIQQHILELARIENKTPAEIMSGHAKQEPGEADIAGKTGAPTSSENLS